MPARTCNCSGPCGPEPEENDGGVSRRGFLTLLGTGVLAATTPGAQAATAAAQAAALDEWKRGLRDVNAPPRRYRSDTHADARFPLGGIGTGGFELGVDGRFTTWQLFNTLRDGHVPFFFGIHAGNTARALQTTGAPPGVPTVAAIEMAGKYPVATLRFEDPALPVTVTMTAFSPFAPLDAAFSAIPAACFVFHIHNPTNTAQTITLGSFLQNVVGYDAYGPAQGFGDNNHPNFGGNYIERVSAKNADGIVCAAHHGGPAVAGKPIHLYTNVDPNGLNTHPVDHAAGFVVSDLGQVANPSASAATVIWIENAPLDLSAETLRRVGEAVKRGATLAWPGTNVPLLDLDAAPTTEDIVFEDFENGYGRWTVTGTAFGDTPPGGTLQNQQHVSGFVGKGLVNSYVHGDDATGKLTSAPFTITRRFIRFLVGGGNHPTTQIRLIVNDRIVRRQSGHNEERLLPAAWDVREFAGQQAHIEIVDDQAGPWGHINVDQIVFGDQPVSSEVAGLLPDLLPDAAAPEQDLDGTGLRYRTRVVGKGRVARVYAPLLATDAALIGARQRAFRALATLAGVPYIAPVGVPAGAPGAGTMGLAVLGGDHRQTRAGFTEWAGAWQAFARDGLLPPSADTMPTGPGHTMSGAVATTVTVPAGGIMEVPFVLTWHYPNRYADRGQSVGNHYATRWPDGAAGVLRDAMRDLPTWRERTERFYRTLYGSTLPYWIRDCLTSQISTIRHPGVLFRAATGDAYGWEGSNGCCAPTCTHVWGYEQTLAHLFPEIERDMRRIDFLHQQNADGGVNNRTAVPSPPHPTGEHPFVDGHASSILKLYREARNHPDAQTYLAEYWPRVRAAVEYLIARDAASSDDKKPDGTLSDDQWNTYDNAIHGVNTFIGTYYLAALRAGEEMARRAGDAATARRFHGIFQTGRENLIARCWNGEYFEQHLPGYEARAGEYGPGCLSDQLIGQWWAHQLGLGYLLPREMVRSALAAIYRHNWRTDFTDFRHNWRKFAGGNDKGLLICTWPRGGRPAQTIPYVDEVWTGVEYQVGAHLLFEGMTDEGLSVVKGARDRYDGVPRAPIPRSPWNEIECGGHYARAMSSWSLLLALSGWRYDATDRSLTLAARPLSVRGAFRAFFSGPSGWGVLRDETTRGERRLTFDLSEGYLALDTLIVETAGNAPAATVRFPEGGIEIAAGKPLTVTLT